MADPGIGLVWGNPVPGRWEASFGVWEFAIVTNPGAVGWSVYAQGPDDEQPCTIDSTLTLLAAQQMCRMIAGQSIVDAEAVGGSG